MAHRESIAHEDYAGPSDQDQNGEINKVVFHAANSFI